MRAVVTWELSFFSSSPFSEAGWNRIIAKELTAVFVCQSPARRSTPVCQLMHQALVNHLQLSP